MNSLHIPSNQRTKTTPILGLPITKNIKKITSRFYHYSEVRHSYLDLVWLTYISNKGPKDSI